MSIAGEAGAAALAAVKRHNGAQKDAADFIVCLCGAAFPDFEIWADHYAEEVVGAALAVIEAHEAAA